MPSDAPVSGRGEEPTTTGAASPLSGSGTSFPRRRLLIVDDDENVTRLYQRILSSQYELVCARNGLEAKDLISRTSFDAILSDISMPEMDGIQLLQAVRERDLDTPVVLVTAEPGVETAIQALEYGALRYLTKPVSVEQLREVVAYAIKVHELGKIRRRALAMLAATARTDADRADLGRDFQEALKLIWMSYQPIVSWGQRTTFGYEALVRSAHPSLATPAALFDVAERLGRVHELGRTIREHVAARVATLPEHLLVFVNLHPFELDDELLRVDHNPLAGHSNRIVFEITERASLTDVADARDRLSRLRAMGFRLAVDDLGAGYAGLSSFIQLNPEIVKIDMSLIRNAHRDLPKQRLVQSILDVCRDMKIPVVSEGVETREELGVLVNLGADLLQGYFFGAPSESLIEIPSSVFR